MSRRILLTVTAPTVIVGLLLFATGLVSAWYVNQLQENTAQILKDNVSSLRAAAQMEITVRQLRFHCFLYLIAPTDELRKRIDADEKLFESWLNKAEVVAFTPSEKLLVGKVRDGYLQYQERFDKLSREVKPFPARPDFQALDSPVDNVVTPCRAFLEENQDTMHATAEESDQLSRDLRLAMLLLGVGGPIGGILSGFGIARGLSRSIYQLSVRVQDMAQHLDQNVGSVKVTANDNLAGLDGKMQHIVRRVEEVAERVQRQQRELLRAEQLSAVGQLAACVAHEIRNPLTAVKMLVGVALREQNRKPLTPDDLRVIHEEIGRLEQTVQNLLDFARLPTPSRAVTDVRDVIRQAVDLVKTRAGQQEVEIGVRMPGQPALAEVDRGQLSTVLVNLFLNALDAMAKGGRLDITLEQTPDKIRLAVRDTGEGIPPQKMRDLFTPFASSKSTGTGLGLSISQRIIQEHGGTISAANRDDGNAAGACFTICLPVNHQAAGPAPNGAQRPRPAHA